MKVLNESRQGLKSPKLYDILKAHGGFMDSKPSFYLHDMTDDEVIGVVDDKAWKILYHGDLSRRIKWAESQGYTVNRGDMIDIYQLKDENWVALIERGGNLGDDEYLDTKVGKLKRDRYQNRLNRGERSYQWSDTNKWGSPRQEEFYMRKAQNDIANQRRARYGDSAVYKMNESIEGLDKLTSKTDITRFTNNLINKLYKVSQPYTSHRFRDNDWRHLKTFVEILRNVEGVEELIPAGTGPYKQSQEGAYKEYKLDITTTLGSKIGGFIKCHFCGPIENPWDVYDMTVGFWKEDEISNINENNMAKIQINENTIRQLVTETLKSVLAEKKVKKIVSECVKRNISENNFKNPIHRAIAAIHTQGKKRGWSTEEINQRIEDLVARSQAINDINKERNTLGMDPHERKFNKCVTSDTFNIDFDDLNYDPLYNNKFNDLKNATIHNIE